MTHYNRSPSDKGIPTHRSSGVRTVILKYVHNDYNVVHRMSGARKVKSTPRGSCISTAKEKTLLGYMREVKQKLRKEKK